LVEFCRSHVSSVCPSNPAAFAAVHGASTGTSSDISLSRVTTVVRSASTSGSGGAAPSGGASLNVDRDPSAT
jgi:hypothetical protein